MNKEILNKELKFKAVKSSGPGGQNVNKVSSKVVLFFDLTRSNGLTAREKIQISKSVRSRLTSEELLILECDASRSQLLNKKKIIARFFSIIKSALYVPKKRIIPKPTKAAIKRNKELKKRRGELKMTRKTPRF